MKVVISFLKPQLPKLTLLILCIVGFLIRTHGIDWDSGHHLHPDERFLTMVTNALKIPRTFTDYLNPTTSTLNPNNVGYAYFVYGIFPLFITKMVGVWLGMDNYAQITLVGRAVSALFDTSTIIAVFLIAQIFVRKLDLNKNISFFAAFVYMFFALPIQQSHFYTADTFATAFGAWSIYFALLYYERNLILWIIVSAIFLGFSIASKVSGVYLLPFYLGLYLSKLRPWAWLKERKINTRLVLTILTSGILFSIALYLSTRIADPYYFESKNILDPKLSTAYKTNIANSKHLGSGFEVWFPPAVQWFSKSTEIEYLCQESSEKCSLIARHFKLPNDKVLLNNLPKFISCRDNLPCRLRIHLNVFGIRNLLVFGIGIPSSMFLIFGTLILFLKHRNYNLLHWLVSVMGLITLYFTTQMVPAMRYHYQIYPILAVLVGIGISEFVQNFILKLKPIKRMILLIVILVVVCGWGVGLLRIYSVPHSRITASKWIYDNLPTGATIALETWDDGLPLGADPAIMKGKTYKYVALDVWGADTEAKWGVLKPLLNKADYYIATSNRAWGSILPLKNRYPIQSKYYQDMINGVGDFKIIKEINSYPGLCLPNSKWCLEVPDQWSEEAFTVYDHPQVLIFKKNN